MLSPEPGICPRMIRKDYWCLLLYLTLAVATGFADLRMRAHPSRGAVEFGPAVVANTEYAPGKYRVLAPFVNHYLSEAFDASPQNVWYVTRLAWILLAYVVMHVYLRTWVAPEAALAGVALVAGTLPLTFTNSWAHPDHVPELALFTLGALMIARRSVRGLAIALALAALNRETSAFLVLLYLIVEPITRGRMLQTTLFGLEWLAIYTGLRLWRGWESYDMWQLARNLSDLAIPLPAAYDPYYRAYAWFVVVLFAPMLWIAAAGRENPPFTRRALLVVPAVVAVALIFSNIIETRIFTPLYTLIVPGLICALFVPQVDGIERPRAI
jgi:hypothetical protein